MLLGDLKIFIEILMKTIFSAQRKSADVLSALLPLFKFYFDAQIAFTVFL